MSDISEIVGTLANLSRNQTALIRTTANGVYTVELQSDIDMPNIELRVVPSSSEYGILHVPKEHKGFFPGYRVQFILETDVGNYVLHMTGANNGTSIGEEAGQYLVHPKIQNIDPILIQQCPAATNVSEGSFKRFYERTPAVVPDTILTIGRITPRLYRLLDTALLPPPSSANGNPKLNQCT